MSSIHSKFYAVAVSQTLKLSYFTPILKSLHWHIIEQRIQYGGLSVTYKTHQSGNASYLYIYYLFIYYGIRKQMYSNLEKLRNNDGI